MGTVRTRPKPLIENGFNDTMYRITLGMPGGGRWCPECGEKNTMMCPSRRKTSDGLLWSSRPRPLKIARFVSRPSAL